MHLYVAWTTVRGAAGTSVLDVDGALLHGLIILALWALAVLLVCVLIAAVNRPQPPAVFYREKSPDGGCREAGFRGREDLESFLNGRQGEGEEEVPGA